MERKRFCSFMLALVLLLTMVPLGVYAEESPGTVWVDTQGEFNDALTDPNVDNIIVESVELEIKQGTELTKDVNIASSASLRISDNGLLIVPLGLNLTLDGNATVRQNGELRLGGNLVNNGSLTVGGAMKVVAPAEITNNGSLTVTTDPAIGAGWISFFEILYDDGPGPADVEVLRVAYSGAQPVIPEGRYSFLADVSGPNSLAAAMAEEGYTGILLSQFQDQGDPMAGPTTGVSIVYPGDLTITKPLDILENDELVVAGDLTIAPEGKLYIGNGGNMSVEGALLNEGNMLVEGAMNVGQPSVNTGYYTLAVGAMFNVDIQDQGQGDHMLGYYVTNQAEWQAALADSAHCNPIVIGAETLDEGAIVIATDTAIACNLIVEGELSISEGVTLTVDLRYDGDTNGAYNSVPGLLFNDGTLELNSPLNLCGRLINNGILLMAANNGDEYGQGWTRDGSIALYTRDDLSGYLENNGNIFSGTTISINHEASFYNAPGGLLEGGCIETWWGLDPDNRYPLANEGLIRDCEIKLDYIHLAYSYLDYSWQDGWYENPDAQRYSAMYDQPGSNPVVLLGLWEYQAPGGWGFTALTPGALSVSSGSGIVLEPLDPAQVSANPAHNTTNKDSYVSMTIAQWGDHEISYTAPDSAVYLLPVTVDLPGLGFYTAPEATRDNYISGYRYVYTPGAGDSFYAIARPEYPGNWTSRFELLSGGDKVTVAATTDPAIYMVTVNEGAFDNFGLQLKIILDDPATSAHWESEQWLELRELEREGLVYSWVDWWPPDTWPTYPALGKNGSIQYQTAWDTDPGWKTLAFFHKHWVGDEATGAWAYTSLSAIQLGATSGSGIHLAVWDDVDFEIIEDPDYNDYAFSDVYLPSFGEYAISYDDGGKVWTLPVRVGLPGVGFYSATAAAMEYYIDQFSYGSSPESRQFYLIANPGGQVQDSWTTEAVIHDGSTYVTVSPTAIKEVFLVTVKPEVSGGFRLHAEIRYFDGANQSWQSDRDIQVSEAPVEGLVFNWPNWNRTPDNSVVYPVVSKDGEGNIVLNTSMTTAVGGATAPLYFRHQAGETWVLDPVDPLDIHTPTGTGITVQEWTGEGADTITDPDYTGYRFAQFDFPNVGDYQLSYTTGSAVYTLPVRVTLPGVGYYSAAAATEENYLNEFTYSASERSFYMIASPDIPIGEGWTCEYEFLDGSGRVDIATTAALGVFLVTVKDTTEGDARLHAKLRYFDASHAERWQSDRDIIMREAEVPGLVYCWPDWKTGDNGVQIFNYPVLNDGNIHYNNQARVSKGTFDWCVFYKSWDDSAQAWIYTPLDAAQLTVSDILNISREPWSDPDAGTIPDNDPLHANYEFTNFTFADWGSYTINYTVGEGAGAVTYQFSVEVTLPDLGAYSSLAGGQENWLPEIRFDQSRTAYLVPTIDLSAVDLAASEFKLGEQVLTYYEDTMTFRTSNAQAIFEAHTSGGAIDYFEVTVAALPFDQDFQLNFRLRNGSGDEITSGDIRFRSDLPDASSAFSGITLGTPTAAGIAFDTFTSLSGVPAQSVRYVKFVAGALSGNGYRFNLTGNSTGTRLYLFEKSGMLLSQSAFENLSQEGRSITLGNAALTEGAEYYLAVHNESGAASDYELSAGLRTPPPVPALSLQISDQGTIGLSVSGAAIGQNYTFYAKIDGQWQNRGSDPYNAEQEPRFRHAFDLVNNGETATAFAVAIEEGGVEGPRAELAVNITRTDTQSDGMDVTLMDFPESESAYLKAGGAVFSAGSYYRMHHEDATGYWNYNGSFFGDGSDVAGGGAVMDESGDFASGFWLLSEYKQTGSDSTYTIGWNDHVDGRVSLGSLTRANFNFMTWSIDQTNKRVDATVYVRTLAAPTPAAVDICFALYDSDGRLIDLAVKDDLPLNGFGLQDSAALYYTEGHEPASCKIFVLDDTLKPYFENL